MNVFTKFRIWMLKRRLRQLYAERDRVLGQYDGGRHIVREFSTYYAMVEDTIDEVLATLRRLDPALPART
jgi:hypothetical protein